MRYVITRSGVALVAGLLVALLAGCTEGTAANKSAAMVLDNAGSVARSAGDKLWQQPQTEPTPIAAQEPARPAL